MKTLYYNGIIITMEKDLYVEAVLVEDGNILQVGNLDEMDQIDINEWIDLKGRTMLPGFIDAHSHFTQVAFSILQVSLNDLKTVETMKEKIDAFIQETSLKDGEWLIARDYDQNIFSDGKHLSLEVLDYLSPNHPLVVHHKSGHMGLFNRLGLRKLGITEQTIAPKGGKIEKDEKGLTGYIEENAFFEYLKKIPMPSLEQLIGAYKKAQEKYASFGITTIQEGMLAKEMLPLYKLLVAKDFLKLDLVAYPDYGTYEIMKEDFKEYYGNYEKHIKIAGIKMFLDGSPQGRTAWMRTPYQGEEEYFGYGTMKDEEIIEIFRYAGKEKIQVIAHCNGDAAAGQFLSCLEKVSKEYPDLVKQRLVIIHGQLIGKDQLAYAKKLGVVISFFVAHTFHWGDVHIHNFGLERASTISPAASAKKNGVVFTFHQDAPVIESNMLETIWCAVNRYTKSEICLGLDERISVLDALKAITICSAYQYFEEDKKGSIAPFKKADFVILDKNPLDMPVEELKNIKVLKTIKEGIVVMQHKDA